MPLILIALKQGHTHVQKELQEIRCMPGLTKVAMYYCVHGYTEVSRLVVIIQTTLQVTYVTV